MRMPPFEADLQFFFFMIYEQPAPGRLPCGNMDKTYAAAVELIIKDKYMMSLCLWWGYVPVVVNFYGCEKRKRSGKSQNRMHR